METVDTTIERIAGSYRDPSGFVFKHEDQIYRSIDSDCHEVLSSLATAGQLEALIERELLVGTEWVTEPLAEKLRGEVPGFQHFLHHQKVEQITYPVSYTHLTLPTKRIV